MNLFYKIAILATFFYTTIYAVDNTTKIQDCNTTYTTKEDKLLYLNITTSTVLLSYGFAHWGYDLGTTSHTQSEGWFSKDTENGGADKVGHAYTGYLMSHIFSYTYEDWGYAQEKSALYGAYSSFLFTSIMEFGDSFSPYGLSYEDLISNTLGAILGFYTYKYKSLGDKLDFRVEYKLHKSMFKEDFTTDYENMKHLLVLKGSGFDSFNNSYLKYMELYFGYDSYGFVEPPYNKRRELFVGIGINLSKLLNTKIFNYYQVPKSYFFK